MQVSIGCSDIFFVHFPFGVSCSPFRVPLARLAGAQAVIKANAKPAAKKAPAKKPAAKKATTAAKKPAAKK